MSRNVALLIIFAICILGPALALAWTGASSIQALGRNPSSAPKVLTAMTVTLMFIEAIALLAFLVIWQLLAPQG